MPVTLGFVISGAFEGRVEHLLSIAAASVAPGDNRWNADGDACDAPHFAAQPFSSILRQRLA
jgi:hypothetical protein